MFVQIPNIGTATHISYHNQPQNPLDKFYICIAKHIIHNLCQNICTYIFCLQIGNWAFFQPYTVMDSFMDSFMDETTYICTCHRVLKVPLINHMRGSTVHNQNKTTLGKARQIQSFLNRCE